MLAAVGKRTLQACNFAFSLESRRDYLDVGSLRWIISLTEPRDTTRGHKINGSHKIEVLLRILAGRKSEPQPYSRDLTVRNAKALAPGDGLGPFPASRC